MLTILLDDDGTVFPDQLGSDCGFWKFFSHETLKPANRIECSAKKLDSAQLASGPWENGIGGVIGANYYTTITQRERTYNICWFDISYNRVLN